VLGRLLGTAGGREGAQQGQVPRGAHGRGSHDVDGDLAESEQVDRHLVATVI
jgi:hypothetical protein